MDDENKTDGPIQQDVNISIGIHPTDDLLVIQVTTTRSDKPHEAGVVQLPMTALQALEFARNIGSSAVLLRARMDGIVKGVGPQAEAKTPEQRSKMN